MSYTSSLSSSLPPSRYSLQIKEGDDREANGLIGDDGINHVCSPCPRTLQSFVDQDVAARVLAFGGQNKT